MDWSRFAGRELGVEEVRNLPGGDYWGWVGDQYLGGGDDRLALRFKNGHSYEPVTRALWGELSRGGVVADIGAHSGTFTLDAFRAGALSVYSVEPHPINYARLVLNVRHAGFPVGGIFYGAASHEDCVKFFHARQMYACHAAGELGDGPGYQYPVISVRLDTLVPRKNWPKLKAVKIDAENATPDVLRGMPGILEFRPDLIVESTEGGMDELLKPLGYRFWIIWESGRIEEIETLAPYNPDNNYNGTMEDCRNRFCSVHDLP